jgi:hypothetical protein
MIMKKLTKETITADELKNNTMNNNQQDISSCAPIMKAYSKERGYEYTAKGKKERDLNI